MRKALMVLFLLALPVQAEESAVQIVNGIRTIDATKLSVAELLALAGAARESASHVNCCDWSGGGCQPELARAAMGVGEQFSRLAQGD